MTKDSTMFRALSPEEQEHFKQFARDNKPNLDQWAIYHPVARAEWQRQIDEALAAAAQLTEARGMLAHYQEGNRELKAQRDNLLSACKGLLEAYASKAGETAAKFGESALHSSVKAAREAIRQTEGGKL